jgi:hypothetical protein
VSNAEAQHQHRKNRRAKGLCGVNGCDVRSGDAFYCPLHAAAHAARMKLARQKARMAA